MRVCVEYSRESTEGGVDIANQIHFRSRFFTKEEVIERQEWLNEHFAKGYSIVEMEEIDTGYFTQLVYDPQTSVQLRNRFFGRGAEEEMDDWLTNRFANGWKHHIHPTEDGYDVIVYRPKEESLPSTPVLILHQFVSLWWLWLLGTIIFGILWYTK